MYVKLYRLLFFLTYHSTIIFVETAEVPSSGCSCENGGLICRSMNLQRVPGQLDENLHTIILDGNNIETINKMDLTGLNNLRTLSLSNNLINNIENGSFSDLVNLQTLLLEKNRLTSLNSRHFLGLTNLQTLVLHGNLDLIIDPCLFSDLISLNILSLQQTKVDLDDALVTVGNGCSRQHSPSGRFPYVENLEILSIGHEGTGSKANTLQNFTSLRKITLFNFTEESFANSDLSNLENLEEVTLLSVSVYPSEFLMSNSLTKLTIAYSTIIFLPRNALMKVPSIKTLHFLNSSLSMIEEGAFSGAWNLIEVNLSFNRLRSLPEGIFEAEHGDNAVLPYLVLSGNEWHCDCKLKWLRELPNLGATSPSVSVKCHTPSDKAGKSIANVNLLDCDSITEQPNSIDLKVEVSTEIITQHRHGHGSFASTVVSPWYIEATSLTHPAPSNPTMVVVYIVAAAGATLLIFLIMIMFICIIVALKKERPQPQHPPSTNKTFSEEDFYYSQVKDNAVYDTTINRNFKEINFTGLTLPELSSPKVSSPNQYLDQKSKTHVESGRADDRPDYVNTQRGHFKLVNRENKNVGRRYEAADQPLYLNTAPKHPPNSK